MKGIIVKSRVAGKDDITKVVTMPEGKSLSWNGGRMNVGDSISLQFTDVNEPSQPLSPEFVADCMKKTSMEGDDAKEWDFKLEHYHRLKAFFEAENVI